MLFVANILIKIIALNKLTIFVGKKFLKSAANVYRITMCNNTKKHRISGQTTCLIGNVSRLFVPLKFSSIEMLQKMFQQKLQSQILDVFFHDTIKLCFEINEINPCFNEQSAEKM
jgi:hypothetical protein